MNKKILISLFALLLIFSSFSNAQELKNYNLYTQNPFLYNPAFAKNDNFLTAYTNTHLQWTSLNGAPKSYDLGASLNFFPNMGAGFSVTKTQHGLFNNIYVNLKYGYQIDLGTDQYLRMGASFGIANNSVLSQNAENVDLSDINLTSDYYNKTVFTTGVGFAYKNKAINAQLIMPQLFEYNSLNLYTIGVLGYDYSINDEIDIQPSVVVRGAKESPVQFDGNIAAKWKKMVWAQIGYRSSNSLIASVGVDIKNYSIGYAYQADMNPITSNSSGSHEIQLIYRFNNNDKTLLTPKVNLFGKVKNNLDDSPVSTQIIVYEGTTSVGRINSDADGKYNIELEPDKTYKIKINAKGFKPYEEMITIPKGVKEYEHNITLISKNTLVTGTITNELTGDNVIADVLFMENNRVVQTVTSKSDGTYSAIVPANKTYNLKTQSANYHEKDTTLSIAIGTQKITQDFELMPKLIVKGIITDATTGTPLSANIELFDNTTNELIASIKSGADGNYSISIPNVKLLSISVSADNYFFQTDNFKIDFSEFETQKDVQLQPLVVGASIILKNIFFDTGKSDLRPESYTELNRLVMVMMQNPDLKVKILGHTDNVGTDAYNMQLSKDRAQAVVDYLVSKGIKIDRLKAEGFGSTKPIDTNNTDEGRQNNRRVEAEIF